MSTISERVLARFLAASTPRQDAKQDVKPVNKPKGIDHAIMKDNGPLEPGHEDTTKPGRKDVRPEDVFIPKPNQVNVRNLAETGKDQSKAVKKDIPKDKGYSTVSQLSQYLIETQGGGGTKPVGV